MTTQEKIIGVTSILIFIVFIIFQFLPEIVLNKLNVQGGKQLIKNPVHCNSQKNLGNYEKLNSTSNFEYQYAISCWFFIDAMQPNTNNYISLINYGNKPNITYNANVNTLLITFNSSSPFENNLSNTILYKNNNILLQKWNNIIINYVNGTMDIFLNGELVQTNISIVPYYTYDNLTIGENNGIKGGICNVVYFNKALNASNIYYLYNLVKNKTPPIE